MKCQPYRPPSTSFAEQPQPKPNDQKNRSPLSVGLGRSQRCIYGGWRLCAGDQEDTTTIDENLVGTVHILPKRHQPSGQHATVAEIVICGCWYTFAPKPKTRYPFLLPAPEYTLSCIIPFILVCSCFSFSFLLILIFLIFLVSDQGLDCCNQLM